MTNTKSSHIDQEAVFSTQDSGAPITSAPGAVPTVGPAPQTARLLPSDIPVAVDVPATCGMLWAVRDEVIARMESRFAQVDARFAQVDARFAQVDARFAQVDARFVQLERSLTSQIQDVKADVARVIFLVEEQNARNKVVLYAMMSVLNRQDHCEKRLDAVEATVRDLAKHVPPKAA
ncbi:MAG: hypothetical protein IPK82_36355 [Polyangiaceae bacterium]|nr:hypothetical protein [Polyangiaceae bacterium]